MTTAGPWSVKGIDPKARELAKDLARRSGMTLGEWLNQMITEGEGEIEQYAPPPARPSPVREIRLSSDAELKRVARALDALTQRMEAAESRSTLAISGIDQQVMGVLSRIEGVERDRTAVAARFDGDLEEVKAAHTKISERLRRISDEDGPRMDAMRALEGALGKIAEKLYDVEGKTHLVLSEVREDLSNSGRRIDRLEARMESEPATAIVDAVVARLTDRIVDAESRTAVAIKAMEASFAGLDQRLKASEAANDDGAPERRFERLAAELSDKIEANRIHLTERLNAAAEGKLDRMAASLKDLAGHVEQGERRSAQAIDRMGREVIHIAQTLGDRVGSVETLTAEAAQQMGGELSRIADAMEHRMGRADQLQAEALEKLGGEIAKIAERLADRIASAERRSAAAIDDVGEQVGRVTERLNERYEASHTVLAERIRASEERTAKLLEEARETIDRRLMETQRRSLAEGVLADSQRISDDDDAAYTGSAASPFPDDPFAPLGPASVASSQDAVASVPPGTRSTDPFTRPTGSPFDQFDDRYREFADDGVDAESFVSQSPPEPAAHPAPSGFEPSMSTRDVVAAARAAARQASERPDALTRSRRRGPPDLTGSVVAPPLEDGERSGFTFALPKRKKKEPAVNLRTLVVASGTAAALAVTAVGATLYLAAESGSSVARTDHTGPAPSAAVPEDHRTRPADATAAESGAPPTDTLALALTAPPIDVGRPATPQKPARIEPPAPTAPSPPGGLDARAYYNTAIQRLQVSDASGTDDLQKAANLGFAPAQFYLAKLYETGTSGVKKDLNEARRWTQRAAEAGDARAMHNLALYEFNGEGGAKDQTDAARWFKRAAELGVIDSQYNLGRLYESGYGVPENKTEAYKWYLIAAAKGDRDAHASAEALRGQLPVDQTAIAERAAEGFVAQKASTAQTAKTP